MSTENWLVVSFIYNCILIAYVIWKRPEIKVGEKIIFICKKDKQFHYLLSGLVETAIRRYVEGKNGRS
jgi:hypothetical protein